MLCAIRERLLECGLDLHPEKTKIVYCQDSDRKDTHDHIKFDFLGYTFRPRRAKNRWGKPFVSFLPAISDKAAKAIRAEIRSWRLGARRNNQSLEEIAKFVNPYVRGWVNSSAVIIGRRFTRCCVAWNDHWSTGYDANSNDCIVTGDGRFTGWAVLLSGNRTCSCCGKLAFVPRLDNRSRMNREIHVRFSEGLGVRFPWATRLIITGANAALLREEVKPLVIDFLRQRGLELSEEKTHIVHIDEGFDFLGFNFRKYGGKLLIKPAKSSIDRSSRD